MEELFIFTRGVAVGSILLMNLKLWFDYRHLLAGRLLNCLLVCVSAYLVAPMLDNWPWLQNPAIALATSVTAIFWLFSLAVFNDWDQKGITVGPLRTALLVLFLIIALPELWFYHVTQALDNIVYQWLFYLSYSIRILFLILALSAIVAHWRQDLVEARRQLRSVFIGLGGAYILMVTFVELVLGLKSAPLLLEVGHSLLLALLLVATATWLIITSPQGLLASLDIPPEAGKHDETIKPDSDEASGILSLTEKSWLQALKGHMETEQGYRNNELSIGKLGERLSIPEHQLRRLINKHLGYRNFNDFLNQYRIGEAAKRLSDPEQERLPILTIALDVGYSSLTPFNRAFKGQYQQTPSEYRRRALTPS